MMNKAWARIGVLVAILAAAGLGVRYGQMQGRGTGAGPSPADDNGFEVLPGDAVRCEPAGALCMAPGDAQTLAAGAEAVAGQQAAGSPRLGRKGVAEKGATKDDSPWTVQLQARLTRPALAGNAIITVADAADVAAGYVTAMRQAKVPAGPNFSARFTLSPADGVLPGRLYHVRVVQLVEQKEVLLAQGDVKLE